MTQISTQGNEIEIDIVSGEFLLNIDPLYLEEIAEGFDKVKNFQKGSSKDLIKLMEETFFPHGGGDLLGYKQINKALKTYKFDLRLMSKFDDRNEKLKLRAIQKEIAPVGVDSASFLILDMINLELLAHLIKIDDLADLDEDENTYVERINAKIGNKGWGYVSSPGIDSGYVFEGDGSYLIN